VELVGLGVVNGIDLDEHAPLLLAEAKRVAHRFAAARIRTDDLLGPGWFGLQRAAQRYDPARGVRFSTFAQQHVSWAMLSYLREIDPVPRQTRLHARQGTGPPVPYTMQLSTLAGENGRAFEPAAREEPSTLDDQDELDRTLAILIRGLKPREEFAVRGYYLHGRTMEDIARDLGVTMARVSQMLVTVRQRKGWGRGAKRGKFREGQERRYERERAEFGETLAALRRRRRAAELARVAAPSSAAPAA
jgi:RNA polymerase sigma factor (sigma-70 family)